MRLQLNHLVPMIIIITDSKLRSLQHSEAWCWQHHAAGAALVAGGTIYVLYINIYMCIHI